MESEMTSRLVALCFDANDSLRLARFWADALHWEIDDETLDEIGLVPTDDTRFRILFLAVPEQKAGKNRIHLDLTSTSIDDQKETVERLVELGARHIDVGQGPDDEHVVLADPEGNEFCVIEPDNSFLADCGRFGSITCDGTREVGYFWSEALGWPLVWDCRRRRNPPGSRSRNPPAGSVVLFYSVAARFSSGTRPGRLLGR